MMIRLILLTVALGLLVGFFLRIADVSASRKIQTEAFITACTVAGGTVYAPAEQGEFMLRCYREGFEVGI